MRNLLSCFRAVENTTRDNMSEKCCTNDVSVFLMRETKNLSLLTFSIMEVHRNIKPWSQHFNMSSTKFIKNVMVPKHLRAKIYCHYISCEKHMEKNKSVKSLHFYQPTVYHFDIILEHFLLASKDKYWNSDTFFSKTMISYMCLEFMLYHHNNWLEKLILESNMEPSKLDNYVLKSIYIKFLIDPNVKITGPLLINWSLHESTMICLRNVTYFSHENTNQTVRYGPILIRHF